MFRGFQFFRWSKPVFFGSPFNGYIFQVAPPFIKTPHVDCAWWGAPESLYTAENILQTSTNHQILGTQTTICIFLNVSLICFQGGIVQQKLEKSVGIPKSMWDSKLQPPRSLCGKVGVPPPSICDKNVSGKPNLSSKCVVESWWSSTHDDDDDDDDYYYYYYYYYYALRILGMSWGVKNTFFEGAGVSLGGSGVSIGGVKIPRVIIMIVIIIIIYFVFLLLWSLLWFVWWLWYLW